MTEEDFDDIKLHFSEDSDAPKRKYKMTDKAKTSKINNMKKARAARLKLIAKRKSQEEKELPVDESEYSESDSESDEPLTPPPKRKHRERRANKEVRTNKTDDKIARLENLMSALIKRGGKAKKRHVHKTVIVPTQQAQAPVQPVVNIQKEQQKKNLLDLFQ